MAQAVGLGVPGNKAKDEVKAFKAEIKSLKAENTKLQAELEALKAEKPEENK